MGALSVDRVVKRYGAFTAVNRVSFEAQPGRILGLLGPNGAGKTSTIRMVTYITVPDEGEVRYEGRPVGPWSQQRMGYLPEERGLYKKLRVEEQLVYLAELKGMPHRAAREKVRYWLERFEARGWTGKKTEELSKGMQQKVQFIATILHDPSLLIFDEPFSGLDPLNADLLRDIILELKSNGRTILFASHRMEQVEQICDDICLISKGTIILQGALREVKRSFGRSTVVMEFSGDASFLDELAAQGRVEVFARTHTRAELHLLDGTPARQVLESALARVDDVYRFELVEPPLSEIFVTVVNAQERPARSGAAAPA